MAAVSGIKGTLAWASGNANNTLNCRQWSVDESVDELDTTDFTTDGPRTFIPGLTGATGSFECFADDTTPVPALRVTTSLVLTLTTGRTITGNAFVTGRNFACDVAGVNTLTVNFRFTGAVSMA